MNKADFKRLMQHAETCQEDADLAAFHLVKLQEKVYMLASVQSICDFNLFWLYQVSLVVIYDRTLEFLHSNKSEFKRKLSIREIIEFDWIIAHNNVAYFEEFTKLIKNSRSKSAPIQLKSNRKLDTRQKVTA